LPDAIFSEPKIYFGGPWDRQCWYILWPFTIF
jgi:hypothetical protein